MSKKSKDGPKFNNKFAVPNDKADEILKLSNDLLIDRATIEYSNWMACVDQKREDLEIERVKDSIKNLKDEIKSDPGYIKLEEEFKAKKEELISEEQARFQEQLKNLLEPFNEDISSFRGMFRLAMEEIKERKLKGALKFK